MFDGVIDNVRGRLLDSIRGFSATPAPEDEFEVVRRRRKRSDHFDSARGSGSGVTAVARLCREVGSQTGLSSLRGLFGCTYG